jgi:protein SCO1
VALALHPHQETGATRRRVCSQLAAAWLLAGCDGWGGSRAFSAMDITGASYGQSFSLLAPDGRRVSLADLRGKVVLLFFGFIQCPDICPTALSRAADVMKQLGPLSGRMQVIFVTVDPERDTPEVLREYTRAFHPSFLGLHASLAETEATARDFRIFYRKVPTGSSYTMDHTAISYVFDPAGRLRLAVRHEQDATTLASDIRRLMKENA